MLRRIAVNRLIVDGREICQCIVEIRDGVVVDYYPFAEEQPYTEWKGGTMIITDGKISYE